MHEIHPVLLDNDDFSYDFTAFWTITQFLAKSNLCGHVKLHRNKNVAIVAVLNIKYLHTIYNVSLLQQDVAKCIVTLYFLLIYVQSQYFSLKYTNCYFNRLRLITISKKEKIAYTKEQQGSVPDANRTLFLLKKGMKIYQ